MPFHASANFPNSFILGCLFGVALLLPIQSSMAQAEPDVSRIENIRLGLTPGRTRLVFDLSAATGHELSMDEASGQLTLTLLKVDAADAVFPWQLLGTPIDKLASEQHQDGDQQYVLDLARQIRVELFTLAPDEVGGDRLVLDLYETAPAEAPASSPIAALNEPETAPTRRAPARQSAPGLKPPAPQRDKDSNWSGYISLDTRLFFHSPAHPGQDRQNLSSAFEPSYFYDWDRGNQRFAFRPFFRYDANDDERTHADIRELYWRYEENQLLLKAGADVVFWGVAESRHLVDIINQTDLVENIDGEDKLGQPMLNLDYTSAWGTWQLYLLPWFRERTFPGEKGRLRTHPVVDTDDPLYESSREEKHLDAALRWSHYFGDWDVGLGHFSGTSRDPLLIPSDRGDYLRPLYLQIDQSSLDVQATKGAWLWKLEAIYNSNNVDDYYAYVGGFEYTWFGVSNSAIDLGLLMEYNYDQRGDQSTSILQDDLYLGIRMSGNDIAGTQLLAAVAVDNETDSVFATIEAVRRLGEYWTLGIETRIFSNVDSSDPLFYVRDDDYIEIQLSRYF